MDIYCSLQGTLHLRLHHHGSRTPMSLPSTTPPRYRRHLASDQSSSPPVNCQRQPSSQPGAPVLRPCGVEHPTFSRVSTVEGTSSNAETDHSWVVECKPRVDDSSPPGRGASVSYRRRRPANVPTPKRPLSRLPIFHTRTSVYPTTTVANESNTSPCVTRSRSSA